MKKIYIKENKIKLLKEEKVIFNWANYFNNLKRIDESINKYLLTESQESKSISAAKKLLIQRLRYNEQQADEFVRVKLRNDLPVLRTPEGGKFILGVTRMFIDGELSSANDIGNLNSTLKLVASDAHINEYDRNLNGMSASELISRFAKAMSDNLNAEKEEINQMVFDTPSDYEIVRIDSFEQASQYGEYTSWCVTHDESMFNSYTSDGINQFYFCLKNGFENVKQIKGEGCPLDEYGLSMIAISVNENGMLSTCTCRWNHDNGGNDTIMSTKEISQVIGMNFFEVFKPNNIWRDLVNDAISRLNAGEPINKVFKSCSEFVEGFAIVKLRKRYNYISQEGNLLSPNQWFDDCHDFNNGFAKVKINRRFNFINTNGELLSPNQWFDKCYFCKNGFVKVELNDKFNFMNQEGKILSPNQWFDYCENFYNGFSKVELNDNFNFINQEGNLLSPNQWFDDCDDFDDGFAKVELNYEYNFINQEGNLLSPNQWFDNAEDFYNGFSIVKLNYEFNFINQEGNLLSPNQWFDNAEGFNDGFAMVELNNNFNFINTNGDLLSPNQWFDNAEGFKDGFGIVELNDKFNFINTNGKILSPNQWFEGYSYFFNGFAKVILNNKFNFINQEGKILSPNQWFDDCDIFKDGVAKVKLNGKKYYINNEGQIIGEVNENANKQKKIYINESQFDLLIES